MGQENLLAWLAHSLGPPFAVIFLFLSVALVALIVVSILAVRRDSVVPPALIQGLEVRLGEDRFQEACDLVRADRSVLARVLAAGLPQLAAGDEKAAAAMEEFGSLESIQMHARLGYVWLIAQLAPLVGLLGTVHGLIAAFEAITAKGAAPGRSTSPAASARRWSPRWSACGSPSWPSPSTTSRSAGRTVSWPRRASSPSASPSGLPRREKRDYSEAWTPASLPGR